MQQRNSDVCVEFEKKIEAIQGKIGGFVSQVENDLQDRKTQLIKDMKGKIVKLQEQQKDLNDQSKKLQRQNIKKSKLLQHQLDLTEQKFKESMDLKNELINSYKVECKFIKFDIFSNNVFIIITVFLKSFLCFQKGKVSKINFYVRDDGRMNQQDVLSARIIQIGKKLKQMFELTKKGAIDKMRIVKYSH